MKLVKNTHREIFRKLSYTQRCLYVVLTVLLFAGPLMIKWVLSSVVQDANAAMYGVMLQWICIFGVLYLLWSVQAVRAQYVFLLAWVLGSVLFYGVAFG
jgi:hypothetical protein